MVSFITFIITIIAVAIVSSVATVFIYRNNVRTIGKVADKVDGMYDKVKEKS